MRKGILSLSRAGKKKTPNTEQAEKQTGPQAPAAEPAAAPIQEKPFVQTIQIPKPGTVQKKKSRKHGPRKAPYTGK
jgi:hypothetical protein